MQRRIHLHQLAEARTPLPSLAMLIALAARLPHPFRQQPTSQRLVRHLQAQLRQLLAGQGRPKIAEVIPILRQHRFAQILGQSSIGGATSQPMHDGCIPLALQAPLNASDLTLGQLQEPSRLRLRSFSPEHWLHDLEHVALILIHTYPVFVPLHRNILLVPP